MKFARYLEETQTPEWKKAYIDFKGLKKRLTTIRKAERSHGGSADAHETTLQTSPQRTASRPLVEDHAKQQSYGSVDHTPPWDHAAPSSANLTEPEGSTKQRSSPANPVRSRSEVVVSRTDLGGGQAMDRRPSVSKIFHNVTRRRPHKTPVQPDTTIESLYSSLNPLEASFFKALDKELEKVDAFYNEHESLAVSKLPALKDQLRELQEHRRLFYEAQATRDEHWNFFQRALGDALGFAGRHHVAPTEPPPKSNGLPDESEQPRPYFELDPFEYQHSKRKLKKAFQEFYRSLELLNDYRVLNLTGFRKALKKFEKTTKLPAQELYMREKIQPRRFAFSGTMDDIMREVESIFASRFEHGDRKKARRRLKSPFLHKSHHFSMFRSGLCLGLGIPAVVSGIHSSFQPGTRERIPEWGPLLEIYAVLFIPIIFSMLIGLNLLIWSRNRINFPFIFELDVRTAIDNREYFELPTILFVTLSYAFWLSFLGLGGDTVAPTTWPAIWLGVALAILLNPLPILSRSSRFWLLKNVAKLLVSGTSRVEFTDFWMGDQFCSLVFTTEHLFTIVCAYANGWHGIWNKCGSSQHWPVPFVLLSLPSFVRLVQSLRRYYDSRLPTHLINGGKYFSSIVAYLVYLIWRVRGSPYNYTFVIWCVFATLSSVYTSSWDLLMDWSVLQPHSKNRFLRPELIYTNNPLLYYFAIISNIIVRFIWVIYIPASGLNRRVRAVIAAILEMLRRFQWNFYRLENEQIGNTDQYRATREVPLPYSSRNGDDDEDDDDDSDDGAPRGEHTGVYGRSRRSLRLSRVVRHDREAVEAEEGAVGKRISRLS